MGLEWNSCENVNMTEAADYLIFFSRVWPDSHFTCDDADSWTSDISCFEVEEVFHSWMAPRKGFGRILIGRVKSPKINEKQLYKLFYMSRNQSYCIYNITSMKSQWFSYVHIHIL